jgi:NADH-quinone oxidoreductase subunit N
LTICFGVLFTTNEEFAFPSLLNALSSFTVFLVFLLVVLFGFDLFYCIGEGQNSILAFNKAYQSIFLVFSFFLLLVTRDFVSVNRISKFEYDILFSFVMLSSICLCFADDFLLVYLAIELQSLALYVFACFNRNSEFSTESGLKYFVFGSVISCFLLLGFAIIYLSFGCLSFEFLYSLLQDSNDNFLFLGILFILVAFLFKVGSFPFHL